jgi:hypothetical protein
MKTIGVVRIRPRRSQQKRECAFEALLPRLLAALLTKLFPGKRRMMNPK